MGVCESCGVVVPFIYVNQLQMGEDGRMHVVAENLPDYHWEGQEMHASLCPEFDPGGEGMEP